MVIYSNALNTLARLWTDKQQVETIRWWYYLIRTILKFLRTPSNKSMGCYVLKTNHNRDPVALTDRGVCDVCKVSKTCDYFFKITFSSS